MIEKKRRLRSLLSYLEDDYGQVRKEEILCLLTPDEKREYLFELQQLRPKVLGSHKQIMSRYLERMREGDKCFNRAENLSQMRSVTRSNLHRKAARAYEKALEILEETFSVYPDIQQYFDRPLDFGFATDLNVDPEAMPRMIDSRSPHCRTRNLMRGLQIRTLKLAFERR